MISSFSYESLPKLKKIINNESQNLSGSISVSAIDSFHVNSNCANYIKNCRNFERIGPANGFKTSSISKATNLKKKYSFHGKFL